jgi:hypothetical protein
MPLTPESIVIALKYLSKAQFSMSEIGIAEDHLESIIADMVRILSAANDRDTNNAFTDKYTETLEVCDGVAIKYEQLIVAIRGARLSLEYERLN